MAFLLLAVTLFFTLSFNNALRPADYNDSWHNGGFFTSAVNNNECLAQNIVTIKKTQRNYPSPLRISLFREFIPQRFFFRAVYPANFILNEIKNDKTSSIKERIIIKLRI